MVMIPNNPSTRDQVDLSFLYCLDCNLYCSYCMYGCGPMPDNPETLNLKNVEHFLAGVYTSPYREKIHCFGLYGGEPSLRIPAYSKIADMLPAGPTRFTITNGTWSVCANWTKEFLAWAEKYNVKVFVSSNDEQIRHQNRPILEWLAKSGLVILKEPDTKLIPMGRAGKEEWSCRYRCYWDQRSRRLGLLPDGRVMMQSCDGVYPIIGHMLEGFTALYKRATSKDWEIHCPKLQSAQMEAQQPALLQIPPTGVNHVSAL